MGKRSDFERFPQDRYNTPEPAAAPLLPHLAAETRFIEPCVGEGYLVGCLKRAGHVLIGAYDLPIDATVTRYDTEGADCFITNPPWRRDVLHPLIVNLSGQLPTWLLIDADWIHTRQSIPYLPRLRTIVSIGRVKWIPELAVHRQGQRGVDAVRPPATRRTSADSLHRPDRAG